MMAKSVRRIIMDQFKSHFKGFDIWAEIEPRLAIMCAELEEPTTPLKKDQVIIHLKKIKEYLVNKGLTPEQLRFLSDELERYKFTRQISLYVEKEDYIHPDIIEKYARLSYGAEGIMGIHLPYTYDQVKMLTNGVYNETGLIKFYISAEVSIQGKIIAELYEHAQRVPIATLIESNKVDKDTGEPMMKKIVLFGERYKTNNFTIIKEIDAPFYVYRFISDTNDEYIILTIEQHTIGDYIITGMATQCDDYKALTETSKLPTKLPYIFVQNVRNRLIKFKTNEELMARAKYLKMTKDNIWNLPFTIQKGKEQYILKQPDWYKWLIWSWMVHQSKGLMNTYPLHMLMIGPPSSGKSVMLNALHMRTNEPKEILSGSDSTLKALVPSFKYNPAKMGYLAECNRYCYCDEFLRCLVNTNSNNTDREEGVGKMNDLLEHQKRSAGSGVSKISVKMTARMFAMTNPVRGLSSMDLLIERMDSSWLSRMLIYFQSDEHIDLIKTSDDCSLKLYDYKLTNTDWVSILDYLMSVPAKYDLNRVIKVYKSIEPALNEAQLAHYNSRHKHHIECIMDGLVKARCLFDNNPVFDAIDEDYVTLELVWKSIISSWVSSTDLERLPVLDRIQFLPKICQDLYYAIVDKDRPMERNEVMELGKSMMSKLDVTNALVLLVEHSLLVENGNSIEIYRWSG